MLVLLCSDVRQLFYIVGDSLLQVGVLGQLAREFNDLQRHFSVPFIVVRVHREGSECPGKSRERLIEGFFRVGVAFKMGLIQMTS